MYTVKITSVSYYASDKRCADISLKMHHKADGRASPGSA